MFENQTLLSKLDNLENVFIGQPLHRETPKGGVNHSDGLLTQYQQSNLVAENLELKRKMAMLE